MSTFKYFIWGLVTSFVLLNWLPQFRYSPMHTMTNAAPMVKQATDFQAVVVAASEWKMNRSPRFYSSYTIHLEPELQTIAGTYQAYGPLATILVWPLTLIEFEKIRIPIVFAFIILSSIFLYYIFRKKLTKEWSVGLLLMTLVFSAPINYLVTRANFELFIAILLAPLALSIHQNKKINFFTYICLGLAIHLKPWTVVFTMISIPSKDLKLFLIPLSVALGLHLALSPWFSIHETWLSMETTAQEAIASLYGYANLALVSTLQMIKFNLPWQAVSLLCFVAILIFNLNQLKEKVINLQASFAFTLCAGMLASAIANFYILISAFFLVWTEIKSNSLQKYWLLLVGILLGSSTSLFEWDGPFKSLILILLLVILLVDQRMTDKAIKAQ